METALKLEFPFGAQFWGKWAIKNLGENQIVKERKHDSAIKKIPFLTRKLFTTCNGKRAWCKMRTLRLLSLEIKNAGEKI